MVQTPDPGAGPSRDATSPGAHASLFTGRSGQLAVMAEFLHRGINVAIPEVDVGDDVFVVRGGDEAVTRVQVKSANATLQQAGSFFAQFNLPWLQLTTLDTPALVYVFATRHENRWAEFIVIRRGELRQLQANEGAGSVIIGADGRPSTLNLRLVFKPATCGTNR